MKTTEKSSQDTEGMEASRRETSATQVRSRELRISASRRLRQRTDQKKAQKR